jgi:hypothetical protein
MCSENELFAKQTGHITLIWICIGLVICEFVGKDGDIEYENIEKNGDIETVTSKNCLKVGNYD